MKKILVVSLLIVGGCTNKKEIKQVTEVLRFVDKKHITHFKPEVEGFHGSKTIWEVVKGYETYWKELEEFLAKTK